MHCLKTTVFIAAFGVICGAAGLSRAAVLSIGTPQPQQESVYLQFTDGKARIIGRGLLNGYKGYRYHRPGYRRHSDNWWYPREAFGAKPVPQQLPVENKTVEHKKALPIRHVRWCEQKYRSYRQKDNTFQPYYGPRRLCRSPYL